ncbi:MAG: FAD-binding oxidoreductase, partial [Acidimicrobiales bacterium]
TLASPGQRAGDLLAEALQPALADGRLLDAFEAKPAELWGLRHEMIDALWRGGTVVAHDLAFARGDVPAFRAEAMELVHARLADLVVADFGHLADGGVHFVLWWPADRGPLPAGLPALREELYELVAAHGGSFSAEHGIGPVNLSQYRRYAPAVGQWLTSSLKSLTDPRGILASTGLGQGGPPDEDRGGDRARS